jgi:hypothetical protein
VLRDLELKFVLLVPPAAIVDNAAVTVASLDTKGWARLLVLVIIGATDIAVAAMKMTYSDTDGSYADIANGNFATGTMPNGVASVVPAAAGATGDNTIHAWWGPCRKRYYKAVLTGGDGAAGAFFCVLAVLSRPTESPNTMAERGFAQELAI